MTDKQIPLRAVHRTADNIFEVSERLYKRARQRGQHDIAERHRASVQDNLDGLKRLLLDNGHRDSEVFEHLETLWTRALRWS